MKKLFVYCPETANKDCINPFKHRDYEIQELNSDPKTFWTAIGNLDDGAILVIFSHGDANGPLMVAGSAGDDMTADETSKLASFLASKKVSLYLLSCHTGAGDFAKALAAAGCSFVAPLGFAVVETGSGALNVFSKEGEKFVGWTGTLLDSKARSNKALTIP